LNARSERRSHEGVLIRVQDDGVGYGCIHPWPELGDAPLDVQLRCLSRGMNTPIVRAALACAKVDAAGRKRGKSLFGGFEIPRSHATLPLDELAFEQALQAGFHIAKVKVGKDLLTESRFISTQANAYPDLRWRFDFNHSTPRPQVDLFLENLGEKIRSKIDFIEDATSSLHVPLAVDRQVDESPDEYDFAIVKPATVDGFAALLYAEAHSRQAVVTSYMDHPLGQCYAAYEAAKLLGAFAYNVHTCGLVTHGLFEPNAFSEYLGEPEPTFHPPPGTGLGFDDLLEDLPWITLI